MSTADWLSRHVAFPFWTWKDGSDVQKYLDEAERHQYLGADELDALQRERLATLLEAAHEHVPYYTDLFRVHDIVPSDIRSWDDFAKIPPLKREDLQSAGERIRARRLPPGDEFVESFSGGTSGRPARFWVSERRMQSRRASTIRHDRWTGWEIGELKANLWSAARDMPSLSLKGRVRKALYDRTVTLDASKLSRESLLDFVELLRHKNPRTWVAYGGVLSLFMQFLEENKIEGVSADAVISSAELLREGERERVRRLIGCEVFNRYGCREVSIVASECGQSPEHAMHISADTVKVEIEPGGPEGRGRILLTDLTNLATPFIRYRIGDVGAEFSGECPCGRGLPLMAPVEGRTTDFIVASDGRVISGATLTVTVLGDLPEVAQSQIIQDRRGEALVRYVPRDPEVDSDDRILELCAEWLGPGMKVEIERVDDIPLTASGKVPLSVSSVDPFEVLG